MDESFSNKSRKHPTHLPPGKCVIQFVIWGADFGSDVPTRTFVVLGALFVQFEEKRK